MGVLVPIFGAIITAIGVALIVFYWRDFSATNLGQSLVALWQQITQFLGAMIFAGAGILARHTSDHGRWIKTDGREGARMNWAAFGRDMISAPLWAMIAGTIVEWGFHGPMYATLAVAGTAGYLAPFLTDIVLDGIKRVIAAATDRVRGGPPPSDGGGV